MHDSASSGKSPLWTVRGARVKAFSPRSRSAQPRLDAGEHTRRMRCPPMRGVTGAPRTQDALCWPVGLLCGQIGSTCRSGRSLLDDD